MKIAKTTTIIGYDKESGKQLFTHPNVLTRDYRGINNLPHANQLYASGFNNYRVIGVRDRTEDLWEIDVRVETVVS